MKIINCDVTYKGKSIKHMKISVPIDSCTNCPAARGWIYKGKELFMCNEMKRPIYHLYDDLANFNNITTSYKNKIIDKECPLKNIK